MLWRWRTSHCVSLFGKFHFSRGLAKHVQDSSFLRLQSRIETYPQQSKDILKSWLSQGNVLSERKVLDLFEYLAEQKHRRAALKLAELARDEGLVTQINTDAFVRELRLASREFDSGRAEEIYKRLPPTLVNEDVNAAFIDTLVKSNAGFKAEKWVRRLPRPKTPQYWSAVISVYYNLDMHDQLLAAYAKLKRSRLKPTPQTYLLLLKVKARLGGLEELEKEASNCLESLGVEAEHGQGLLTEMLEAYGYLGEGEMVDKVWTTLKTVCRVPLPDSYMAAVDAYAMVGELEKAELVFEEYLQFKKPRGNPYFKMVDVYAKLGMPERAEQVLMERKKPTDKYLCNPLISHYLKNKKTADKALKMVNENMGIARFVSYENMLALLKVYEERKDVRTAESVVSGYLSAHYGDVRLYNSLLRLHATTRTIPDSVLLEKFEGIEQNEETQLLLAIVKLPTQKSF